MGSDFNSNFGNSMNGNIGRNDGFKLGKEARIGMDSRFEAANKGGLDSIYAEARRRKAESRLTKINESPIKGSEAASKTAKGALEGVPAVGARKFVGEIMKSMEKHDAYKYFGGSSGKDKFNTALKVAGQIKGGKFGTGSFFRREDVRRAGRDFLSGKISLEKKDMYTSAQAKKAIGKVIGEITGDKDILRRSNRT